MKKLVLSTLILILICAFLYCSQKFDCDCIESKVFNARIVSMFCDNSSSFIITDNNSKDFLTFKTFFSFKNDTSLTWNQKIVLPGVEYHRSISVTKNNVFLTVKYFIDSDNYTNYIQKLYKIDKKTYEYNEIFQFESMNVKHLQFINDSVGYAIANYSDTIKQTCLLSTYDSGKTWSVYKIDRIIDEVQFKSGNLFFSSLTLPNNDYRIIKMNIDNYSIDSFPVDMNLSEFYVDSDSSVWLAGKEQINRSEHKTILKRKIGDKIEVIKEFARDSVSFVNSLYKYNQFIAVNIGKIDYSIFAGLGGTIDKLYFSFDEGKTWEESCLSQDYDHLLNLAFYKNERVIANVGYGKIVTCSLIYQSK